MPECSKGNEKQQRREFNSHQITLPDSQYSSQTGNAIVFKGTKCSLEERLTCSIILEHPQSYFFFIQKTVSNIRQSHLMTKPRTYACICFFLYNIELAYKGRQITKSKSHVSFIHYILIGEGGEERDHCCVKEYIEMPAKFHSRLVSPVSMRLKRLLTLKGNGDVRPAAMR